MTTKTKLPYIVCCGATAGRCVIYGYVDAPPVIGEPCTLTDARMILRWRGGGGLLGVAAKGPRKGSELTAAVLSTSAVVRESVQVSAEAAKAIDAWPAC
jgi:hypothetical protein